jgi:hypothetical protein
MTAEEVASVAELSVGKATGAVGVCPPLQAASARFNENAKRRDAASQDAAGRGLKQAWQRKMSNNIRAGQARH